MCSQENTQHNTYIISQYKHRTLVTKHVETKHPLVTKSVSESVTKLVSESVTESMSDSVNESLCKSVSKSVINPVTK